MLTRTVSVLALTATILCSGCATMDPHLLGGLVETARDSIAARTEGRFQLDQVRLQQERLRLQQLRLRASPPVVRPAVVVPRTVQMPAAGYVVPVWPHFGR